jgi:toxin ParE1/3/4
LANILATSAERWGHEGRQRYAAVLADAMRQVAAEPGRPLTRTRPDLRSGIRSFHVRYARRSAEGGNVRRPVHVLYYRVAEEGVIEIIRVLHERMEPSRHLDEPSTEDDI